MNKPKVLVVEDDTRWYAEYKKYLGGELEFVFAATIPEAEQRLAENSDIKAIVMDFTVPGINGETNTLPLIRRIKESQFGGYIIACGSNPACQKIQLSAGCSHDCNKENMFNMLREIFKLQSIAVEANR